MYKILLFLSLFIFAHQAQAKSMRWELNDVSYLFSLPTENDAKNFLLNTYSQGEKGALFPKDLATYVDDLIISYDRPEPNDIYLSLKVVGMRIDPCFKFSLSSLEKCNPQLRLIWQPTAGLNTEDVRTFDGALHTFYSLSESEFQNLKNYLIQIKSKNEKMKISTVGKALGVHPAFLNNARRDAFSRELKKVILSFAGEKNLVRFTFMKLMTTDLWWSFGGMDRGPDGHFKKIRIARLPEKENLKQDFFNEESQRATAMRGTIMPNVNADVDNLEAFSTGYGLGGVAGEKIFKKAMQSLNRIENPKIYTTESLDCVHCHITDGLRVWAKNERSELNQKFETTLFRYTQDFLSGQNLSLSQDKKKHNKSLRAFGYYKTTPSINQRAINESSLVAQTLNQSIQLFKKNITKENK